MVCSFLVMIIVPRMNLHYPLLLTRLGCQLPGALHLRLAAVMFGGWETLVCHYRPDEVGQFGRESSQTRLHSSWPLIFNDFQFIQTYTGGAFKQCFVQFMGIPFFKSFSMATLVSGEGYGSGKRRQVAFKASRRQYVPY